MAAAAAQLNVRFQNPGCVGVVRGMTIILMIPHHFSVDVPFGAARIQNRGQRTEDRGHPRRCVTVYPKYTVRRSIIVRFFLCFFFCIPFIIFARLFFCLPPISINSGNSDSGSHIIARSSSPLPTRVRAFCIFVARRLQLFSRRLARLASNCAYTHVTTLSVVDPSRTTAINISMRGLPPASNCAYPRYDALKS